MKRFGILLASAALGAALVASGPALAFRGGGGFGGFHGGGFHGGFGGFHGGFGGRGFAGGWGGGWGHGWRGGGWNRGWGGGWPVYAGLGLGLGYGLSSWDYGYPYDYSYGYGYPYDYGYGYPGYSAPYAAATAPLVTGRSVATGQLGNYCTTPAKTCELYHASYVGNGCSCRVPGGHARGSVSP
jgi:hypothetical protein